MMRSDMRNALERQAALTERIERIGRLPFQPAYEPFSGTIGSSMSTIGQAQVAMQSALENQSKILESFEKLQSVVQPAFNAQLGLAETINYTLNNSLALEKIEIAMDSFTPKHWDTLSSLSLMVDSLYKGLPTDYFGSSIDLAIPVGNLADAVMRASAPDIGVINKAVEGMKFALEASDLLKGWQEVGSFSGIVERIIHLQEVEYDANEEQLEEFLREIEALLVPQNENKFLESSKNQFLISIAFTLIGMLFTIYAYLFPLASAKEIELNEARLAVETRQAEALERQADALERIANVQEVSGIENNELERVETLEGELSKYHDTLENLERFICRLKEYCVDI